MKGLSRSPRRNTQVVAKTFCLCFFAACLLAKVASTPVGNSSNTSGRRDLLYAKRSRQGASTASSAEGFASHGMLRMTNKVGRRKVSRSAELDALLDSYAELHKRCLFDESYQGHYILVSMGDSFSGASPGPCKDSQSATLERGTAPGRIKALGSGPLRISWQDNSWPQLLLVQCIGVCHVYVRSPSTAASINCVRC